MAADLEARGLHAGWKVWYDEPGRASADAARFNDAQLITMTTHGRGGLGRLLLGSVAQAVVRMAAVPVLLVRGELSWQPGSLDKIVVALDGSELAEAILPVVARLAGPLDFSLELIRAIEPPGVFDTGALDDPGYGDDRAAAGRRPVTAGPPGWLGIVCESEEMALWLMRAIVVENVMARREGAILYLPAGPRFSLEGEIKNVVTAVAKTHHYWTQHVAGRPARSDAARTAGAP